MTLPRVETLGHGGNVLGAKQLSLVLLWLLECHLLLWLLECHLLLWLLECHLLQLLWLLESPLLLERSGCREPLVPQQVELLLRLLLAEAVDIEGVAIAEVGLGRVAGDVVPLLVQPKGGLSLLLQRAQLLLQDVQLLLPGPELLLGLLLLQAELLLLLWLLLLDGELLRDGGDGGR